MPYDPINESSLAPGDAVFCLETLKNEGNADGRSGPNPGRVYRIERIGPDGSVGLEALGTTEEHTRHLAHLPAAWFRKATEEEIATERRKKAWETDQLMITAMMETLNAGQPLTGDLRHWWINRY